VVYIDFSSSESTKISFENYENRKDSQALHDKERAAQARNPDVPLTLLA